MKIYSLHIETNGDSKTFDSISKLLNLKPEIDYNYSTWSYHVEEKEGDPYFDFIEEFLKLLAPIFNELEELGIKRNDILFWVRYEYQHQCAMEFSATEMKRMGEAGISLNIDCWEK